MRSVEKIEQVFKLKLVASYYIIAASVSWWIKQRVLATVIIKLHYKGFKVSGNIVVYG